MNREERALLLSALNGISTVDEKERLDIAAVVSLLQRDDAESRQTFDPGHLTASAFVIHPGSGRILLHHHRRLDRWLQLGGHLEPGELPAQAALREAREESGLEDLSLLNCEVFDVDVHDIPAGRGEPAHQHHDLRYIVIAPRSNGELMDPRESIDLAWFTLDEARAKMNAWESRRAIDKIEALLRDR